LAKIVVLGEFQSIESLYSSSFGPNDRECDGWATKVSTSWWIEVIYFAVVLEGADNVESSTSDGEHSKHDTEREQSLLLTG
jgi:hypothetical protein